MSYITPSSHYHSSEKNLDCWTQKENTSKSSLCGRVNWSQVTFVFNEGLIIACVAAGFLMKIPGLLLVGVYGIAYGIASIVADRQENDEHTKKLKEVRALEETSKKLDARIGVQLRQVESIRASQLLEFIAKEKDNPRTPEVGQFVKEALQYKG